MSDLESRVNQLEEHITQLTIQTERIASSVEQLANQSPKIEMIREKQHLLELRVINNENAMSLIKFIAGAFLVSGAGLIMAYIFGGR